MTENTIKRLRWRCRRGMRELDLLLERYVDRHAAVMSEAQLAVLERFLDSTDMDLYDWVTGRARPSDPHFINLVDELVQAGE